MYYKQLCRRCQVGFNPYRVESIVCKVPFTPFASTLMLISVFILILFVKIHPPYLIPWSNLFNAQGCSQTCCSCEKKQRHINMKRPHRQDLCCRCRGMTLSCDATYSFKYIV